MNITGLRAGNLIRVKPKNHQEGFLFIKDMQPSSVICEMYSPRRGYMFRIKYEELLPIYLTQEWLSKTGFTKDPEHEQLWYSPGHKLRIRWAENGVTFEDHSSSPSSSVHELQNEYKKLTGEELVLTDK